MSHNFWPESWQEHRDKKGMQIVYMAPKRYIHAASDLCGAIGRRYLTLATWAQLIKHDKDIPALYANHEQLLRELIEILELFQTLDPNSFDLTENEVTWCYASEELGDVQAALLILRSIAETRIDIKPTDSAIEFLLSQYNQAADAQIRLLQRPTRSYCFG